LTDLNDEAAVLGRLTPQGTGSPASPFNIGVVCADRHPSSRLALLDIDDDTRPARKATYGQLAPGATSLATLSATLASNPATG
jgi:hypothetical protein